MNGTRRTIGQLCFNKPVVRLYSYIPLIVLLLTSLITVVILYALSEVPFRYRQDFTRVHRDDLVKLEHVRSLAKNTYYLAGIARSQIYFGDRSDSLHLLVMDQRLGSLENIRIKLEDTVQINAKTTRIEIDSPFFYLKDGAVPTIFEGDLGTGQASRVLDSLTFFEQAVALGKHSFACQSEAGTVSHKTKINILCKAMPQAGVTLKTDLLEGKPDNYYSTLGVLGYSRSLSWLVYTYLFRDEYVVLDTNLNLLYKATSIGKVSQANIRPLEIANGIYTLASTPAVVNRSARVFDNLLFIDSNLMATNESREEFDHSTVIDVYDLMRKKYRFSFYLPDYDNLKTTSFGVGENRIVAVYNEFVAIYSFGLNDIDKILTDR